jgi:hypothetical protein
LSHIFTQGEIKYSYVNVNEMLSPYNQVVKLLQYGLC